MTDNEPHGTCDWGDCDHLARFWREHEGQQLPVCFKHSAEGEKFYGELKAAHQNAKGSFA